jgi:hypothetical protein
VTLPPLLLGGIMARVSAFKLRLALNYIVNTNRSNHNIGLESGLHHDTIKAYRSSAIDVGLTAGKLKSCTDSELDNIVHNYKKDRHYKTMPDCEYVNELITKYHYDVSLAYEEYIEEHRGLELYSETHFRSIIRDYRKSLKSTVLIGHEPGEECQIDFVGKSMFYRHCNIFNDIKIELFASILPCSQFAYCIALPNQNESSYQLGVKSTFDFFGGVPHYVTTDNLKSGVTKPGKIPEFNKKFKFVCRYYDVLPSATRPGHPQDKGLVENAVKLVTKWITYRLRRQRFFSLDEINREIQRLLIRYNSKVTYKLDGSRWQRFIDFDRGYLRPLPNEEFIPSEFYGEVTVTNRTCRIHIKKHTYTVPKPLKDKKVSVRLTKNTVEVWYDGLKICTHKRKDGHGDSVLPEHLTAKERALIAEDYPSYIEWASKLDDSLVTLMRLQVKNPNMPTTSELKRCQKIVRLNKIYGLEALIAATKHKFDLGKSQSYDIESCLVHKTYITDQTPNNSISFPQQLSIPGV